MKSRRLSFAQEVTEATPEFHRKKLLQGLDSDPGIAAGATRYFPKLVDLDKQQTKRLDVGRKQ
jgi:hypothetical protein